VNDVLNRRIGFVVGGFEGTLGLHLEIGPVVEQTVGQRPAEPLMKEDEQERDAEPLVGEAIRVAAAVACEEAAMTENMELGLLIRGGPVPGTLAAHFRELMATGVLEEVL